MLLVVHPCLQLNCMWQWFYRAPHAPLSRTLLPPYRRISLRSEAIAFVGARNSCPLDVMLTCLHTGSFKRIHSLLTSESTVESWVVT